MENSIEKEEEILNNIKAYMQENIDKGYHKFVYNDLGYDEKCVDVINAIEHILSDYKRVLKENEILKEEKEQAWEEWNNLEQGSYEIEQKLKQQIKELQKENEKLKADNYELNNRITDLLENIPIQKVKDKIEYLKDYIEENSDEQGYWGNINPDVIYGQIEILEEVLKESEDNNARKRNKRTKI